VNATVEEMQNSDALILSIDNLIESWILDLGVLFHSTSCKELMYNFFVVKFEKIYLANDEHLDIMEKCEIHIKSTSGYQWKLHDIKYVPELKRNIISISQLEIMRYKTIFGDSSWKIVKDALVATRETKSGALYMTKSSREIVAIAESEANFKLWHHKLWHISKKGMKLLASKGKLRGLKSIDIELHEDYVLGKQKCVNFLKIGREPKKGKLELVHTDV